VIPLEMVAAEPISDPKLEPNREVPAYARHYSR
jgi:hypothetical protein